MASRKSINLGVLCLLPDETIDGNLIPFLQTRTTNSEFIKLLPEDLRSYNPPSHLDAVILLHPYTEGRLSLTDVTDARYTTLLPTLKARFGSHRICVIAYLVGNVTESTQQAHIDTVKAFQPTVLKTSDYIIICGNLKDMFPRDLKEIKQFMKKSWETTTQTPWEDECLTEPELREDTRRQLQKHQQIFPSQISTTENTTHQTQHDGHDLSETTNDDGTQVADENAENTLESLLKKGKTDSDQCSYPQSKGRDAVCILAYGLSDADDPVVEWRHNILERDQPTAFRAASTIILSGHLQSLSRRQIRDLRNFAVQVSERRGRPGWLCLQDFEEPTGFYAVLQMLWIILIRFFEGSIYSETTSAQHVPATPSANVVPVPASPYASMTGIEEHKLNDISNAVGADNDTVNNLGFSLGFSKVDIDKYDASNHLSGKVSFVGTRNMLFEWKRKTSPLEQKGNLRKALIEAQLIDIAEKNLQRMEPAVKQENEANHNEVISIEQEAGHPSLASTLVEKVAASYYHRIPSTQIHRSKPVAFHLIGQQIR